MAVLNEENSTDIDDVSKEAEVHDDEHSIADDMGEQNSSEEPNSELQMEHDFAVEHQLDEMKERIKQLEDSFRVLIDSGATILEGKSPITDGNYDPDSDKEEPFIYLEDLDYSI